MCAKYVSVMRAHFPFVDGSKIEHRKVVLISFAGKDLLGNAIRTPKAFPGMMS
jgi:hypothetical protein